MIEAVPERMDLKVALLQWIEAYLTDDAIIGSNTSSLSISAMQNALRQPHRMIGLHFFNPVHINRLVEIVRGNVTSPEVVDASREFVRGIRAHYEIPTDDGQFNHGPECERADLGLPLDDTGAS